MRLFLVFLFVISLPACRHSQKQAYFSFNENTVDIKIPEFTLVREDSMPKYGLTGTNFLSTDTGLIIMGVEFGGNKLVSYNLDSRHEKITSFDSANTSLLDYKYFNSDSILFFGNSGQKQGFHDSIFFWADASGKIWKYLEFDGLPFKSSENPEYINNDDAAWWMPNFFGTPVVVDNKLIVQFRRNMQYFGAPNTDAGLPIAGLMNIKTGINSIIPVKYPDYVPGKTRFGRHFDIFFSAPSVNDNAVLFSFKHSPKIYKYSITNKKVDTFNLKSVIYDTVMPFDNGEVIKPFSDSEMPQPAYYGLQYNHLKNQYYRSILQPKKYAQREYSFQIIDGNLNLIAEGFLPNARFPVIHYADDKIIQFAKASSPGYVKLKFYDMKLRTGTNKELIARIKSQHRKSKKRSKQSFDKYIKKNIKPESENFTAVFQISGLTCGGTTEMILYFFGVNQQHFTEHNVHLIIDTKNTKEIRKRLSANNINPKNNTNISIDSLNMYSKTINPSKLHTMPRVIVVRENKIVKDTIFDLTDKKSIENFQKFIINSGKEQMRLKEKTE